MEQGRRARCAAAVAALALTAGAGSASAQYVTAGVSAGGSGGVSVSTDYIGSRAGDCAGTLIINGRRFYISTRTAVREQVRDAFYSAGIRATVRGSYIYVPVGFDPPQVVWLAGAYRARVTGEAGCIRIYVDRPVDDCEPVILPAPVCEPVVVCPPVVRYYEPVRRRPVYCPPARRPVVYTRPVYPSPGISFRLSIGDRHHDRGRGHGGVHHRDHRGGRHDAGRHRGGSNRDHRSGGGRGGSRGGRR